MEEEKNNYKAEQREREEKKEAEKRAAGGDRARRKWMKVIIAVVIVFGLGYLFVRQVQKSIPKGEDLSVAVALMEASHIAEGSDVGTEYTSNPPTSGPHFGTTARSGFREEEIPDGHIIHNLEHGDVWISYHPRILEEAKQALKQFGAAKVIITPRSANEQDIAIASWGRLDTFDLEGGVVPEQRIREFIFRWSNKGPEAIPGASGGI